MLPSGPWYQVIVIGSNACKSLYTVYSPLPAYIMILFPARHAVWPYLGAGGVPVVLGLVHLLLFTSNIIVSFNITNPVPSLDVSLPL